MKIKIKKGALISHDFKVSQWPDCRWPMDFTPDENLIFEAKWTGKWWECRRNGFGDISGGYYGNGSIFVHDENGIIAI